MNFTDIEKVPQNAFDLSGETFTRLKVISPARNEKGCLYWRCICECGKIKYARASDLKRGKTKSCGCYQYDSPKIHNTKHSLCGTRIYNIYNNMKSRCLRKSNPKFHRYGGRGIKICGDWLGSHGFINFVNWAISNGYEENLLLDRIDNDGDYCPENCRWTNNVVQARNRSTNHIIKYNGEEHCIAEWEEILGVKKDYLRWNLKFGRTIDEFIKKEGVAIGN